MALEMQHTRKVSSVRTPPVPRLIATGPVESASHRILKQFHKSAPAFPQVVAQKRVHRHLGVSPHNGDVAALQNPIENLNANTLVGRQPAAVQARSVKH